MIRPAFDPDPDQSWAFVFAHPDDELSIAAWIRRLTRAGARVDLIFTHGTPERFAEAGDCARLLGLDDAKLATLNFPDRYLAENLSLMRNALSEVLEELRPDRVVTCAFEQGHLDHDATHVAVVRSFSGPVFEVPLYHTYAQPVQVINEFSMPDRREVLELSEEETELKRRLLACYPSQHLRTLLVWYSLLQKLSPDRPPLAQREVMRPAKWTDFRHPSHPEPLAARVVRSSRWVRWLAALERFEASEGLSG